MTPFLDSRATKLGQPLATGKGHLGPQILA